MDPFMSATGPGAHMRGLSQSLTKLGCEVHMLVLNPKNSNRVVNGIQMHYRDLSLRPRAARALPLVPELSFNLISFREVDKLCREYKMDIIHGQSPSSYGYGLLRRSDIPFVVTQHASFGEYQSLFNIPLSFMNRNPVIELMTSSVMLLLTFFEVKRADKVIAVSKSAAEETIAYCHLPRRRVVAIHNGIDLAGFTDLRVDEENENHTLLSVGRLSWRKGYKYLIDAMPNVLSQYPDAKLLLLGDGEQKTPLRRHVKKLGIESSVLFLEEVSAERLHSLYHEAEVYVQPSLYEPFGITILEAMAMKKPILATRVGGIPEIITNEVEGLLVEPRNSLNLAEAIINLLSDASYRRRLGDNARRRVEREFTWEAIAKKTIELYRNLLDDN
jgi:glycosyltransferase involved in cell wall biosynthesis